MKNFALLIGVLAVSVLGFELALRQLGFAPHAPQVNSFFVAEANTTWSVPDPELGWVNKAGISRSIGNDPAPMTFWDFARRASRPDSTAPLNKRVVTMIVGGSVAQSYGVRDKDSFPYLLAERYPDLWIENFGNGGYGTVQSRILAERAYDHFYTDAQKPKLLIATFADSHMLRNVSDQSWVYSISDPEGRYVSPPHFRMAGDNLIFHPFHTINFWPLETHSASLTLLHDIWLRSYRYNTSSQSIPVAQRILREFTEFAQERDMKLVLVIVSDDTHIANETLKNQAIPYVDCSGPERADPKQYLLAGNGHPNAKLHGHLAACVGDWLDKAILPDLLSSSATQ